MHNYKSNPNSNIFSGIAAFDDTEEPGMFETELDADLQKLKDIGEDSGAK